MNVTVFLLSRSFNVQYYTHNCMNECKAKVKANQNKWKLSKEKTGFFIDKIMVRNLNKQVINCMCQVKRVNCFRFAIWYALVQWAYKMKIIGSMRNSNALAMRWTFNSKLSFIATIHKTNRTEKNSHGIWYKSFRFSVSWP